MADIQKLLQEIPTATHALLENHGNLQKVADYCEKKYLEASDKTQALAETKAFVTQSLASVAYQISSLSQSILHLLEFQTADLHKVELTVTYLSQTVDMHKDKVFRREIGSLTKTKKFVRSEKIVSPSEPQQQGKYSRKPITYNIYDDMGHGVKDSATQLGKTGTMSRKASTTSLQTTPAPGSAGRTARVPEPVQPPVIPEAKMTVTIKSSTTNSSDGSFTSAGSFGHGTVGKPVPTPVLPEAVVDELPPPPPSPPSIHLSPFSIMPSYSSKQDGLPPPPLDPLGLPPPPPVPCDLPPPPPMSGLPTLSQIPPPPALLSDFLPPAPASADVVLPPPVDEISHLPPPPSCTDVDFQALPPPPPDYAEDYYDAIAPLPPPALDFLPGPGTGIPNNYIEKVVAVYSYTQDKADELSFEEGEIIYVINKNSDGWYEGATASGASGFFPGNYVEPAT
ncbi:abl interactor 1-like isoform X1 [Protopterus annectens]|uniref:abl interactor 1-like isoform X1 n=1 Tax=Protopterus annectens TaxID=7888 RepID=UPI001CF9E836|nr:abl interactor 1-like isoform X1 [Protopterus annectens]